MRLLATQCRLPLRRSRRLAKLLEALARLGMRKLVFVLTSFVQGAALDADRLSARGHGLLVGRFAFAVEAGRANLFESILSLLFAPVCLDAHGKLTDLLVHALLVLGKVVAAGAKDLVDLQVQVFLVHELL